MEIYFSSHFPKYIMRVTLRINYTLTFKIFMDPSKFSFNHVNLFIKYFENIRLILKIRLKLNKFNYTENMSLQQRNVSF